MRIGFCTLYQGCQYFSRIATNILRNSNFIWCPDSIRLPFGLQTKTNFTVRNYYLIFNNLNHKKIPRTFKMLPCSRFWYSQFEMENPDSNFKWKFGNTNEHVSIPNGILPTQTIKHQFKMTEFSISRKMFQIPTRKSQFQMQYCQFHRANLN